MREKVTHPGPGGAYRWEAPITNLDNLSGLRYPAISVDDEATQRVVELAESIFGDFLSVRLKTSWWWSLGMTGTLIRLRGPQRIMLDMVDNPEGLHRGNDPSRVVRWVRMVREESERVA